MAAIPRPNFYKLIAIALALFMIAGFSRTYYLRFLSDLPPMTWLVHLHGLVFTAWLVLFVVQTRLIASHRVALHMKLGIAGAVLALLVVAVGIATVMGNSVIPRIRPTGLTPQQATVVPFISITLFASFIGLAIAMRRKPAWHKRLMVLAMIAVLSPAASRICTLLGLRDISPQLIPAAYVVFLAWCLVHDWRRHHIVHPAYVVGGLVIVASWPLRIIAGRSEWYQPVGEWAARWGAHLH